MIECTSVTSMRREVVVCDVQKMWKDTFKTPEFVTVLLAKMIFTDLYESVITWHSWTVCLETVTERMHHNCMCMYIPDAIFPVLSLLNWGRQLCGQNKCIIKCCFKKVTKGFPSGVHLGHYTLHTVWSFCNWGCCFQSRRRNNTLWREIIS